MFCPHFEDLAVEEENTAAGPQSHMHVYYEKNNKINEEHIK